MHLGQKRLADRFELDDLRLIDGPSMRGTRTVVHTVPASLETSGAAFVVFNDVASEAVVREVSEEVTFKSPYPLAGSIASDLRMTRAPIKRNDLTREQTLQERISSGAGALMAAPVLAPDGRAAGMLVALERSPRLWSDGEMKRLEDLAHLISQEIMLRASFATLGILARERSRFLI